MIIRVSIMDGFVSSRLSEDGELLNLTWNDTSKLQQPLKLSVYQWDDAAWVMSACFIIFGMQTGFGMLGMFAINFMTLGFSHQMAKKNWIFFK